MLTRLAAGAKASATMALNSKANALIRQGQDVAVFTVGEPDFDTPDNIKQAAHLAIQSGFTKYTDAAGMPELREAIAAKLREENGVEYAPEEVLVSNGGKHALYQILVCLAEEGGEVLIPAPYWVSYVAQVRACGATPVIVDCVDSPGMKPTPDDLSACVTERTRGLILNSPCNPTGAVLDAAEIEALVQAALENDLWIVSDEIYEKLIYDGARHVSPASLSEKAREHVITLNGVSKTYAMTGWRIGYAAGPREVIAAAGRLQSHMTSAPNSIAQRAAIEALTGPQGSVDEMRQAFDERRRLLVEGLDRLPGVRCAMPSGAFYAFPNVEDLLGRAYGGTRVENSLELCAALLDQVRVAVVPGSAFGAEGYVRFSYAASTETIRKGLDRLAEFIATADD